MSKLPAGPFEYMVESSKRFDSFTGEPRHTADHWVTCKNGKLAILCDHAADVSAVGALFAAAPEMLEALKLAREVLKRFQPSDKIAWSEVEVIQDAIAKAEGKQ